MKLSQTLKQNVMKNLFKFGFLALTLSLSVAACSSEKKADATDSTMTDTTMSTVDTTVTDSGMVDTAAADTTKM
jgi:hypothetical protein